MQIICLELLCFWGQPKLALLCAFRLYRATIWMKIEKHPQISASGRCLLCVGRSANRYLTRLKRYDHTHTSREDGHPHNMGALPSFLTGLSTVAREAGGESIPTGTDVALSPNGISQILHDCS